MDFFKKLLEVIQKENIKKTLVVAVATDIDVLKSVEAARLLNIVNVILIGDKKKIVDLCKNLKIDCENYQIINELDEVESCKKAVTLIREKKAQILMKGFIDTSVILKEVLSSTTGLRLEDKLVSHIVMFQVATYHKPFIITDCALNIAPTLVEKKKLIDNAVGFMRSLGVKNPKVACLCAKEKVSAKMQATVDAEELRKMNEQGIIKNCIVSGPLALDIAINKAAAEHKNIKHPVAGDADILLVPEIETGNTLYKSLTYFANADAAGIIIGTSAPIVLTSRSDSEVTKLNSILLAVAHDNK